MELPTGNPRVGPAPLLEERLGALNCAPFDAGGHTASPSMTPKRPRMPPELPLPLPALADMPRYPALPSSLHAGEASTSSAAMAMAIAPDTMTEVSSASPTYASDWKMVLYHDRNIILHNPGEQPQFRSRRLSLEESTGSDQLANASFGRCPLCRQTIDARFAFAAQAYFDLLQRAFRASSASQSGVELADPSLEPDLLEETDLYRILGVTRNARVDDIKRAYRKRSLMYHPDKKSDDPYANLKFQKVAEAYSILSDEHKRAKYDHRGDMDLEGFDIEHFMSNVGKPIRGHDNFKRSGSGDMDTEDLDMEQAVGDNNPFLLAVEPPAEDWCWEPGLSPAAPQQVVASEGGAAEEAAAVAALRHLPSELLNTGYYARFFKETRKLGSGSFGTVFLCRHVLDDLSLGDYAVKKVPVGDNKAWLRDMIREVKTFERLHHPNVVEYKHSWLELSRTSPFCPFVPFLFILMQYCNGGSLGELIWSDGDVARPKAPLPAVHIWHLLLDILAGLQHLHRQGILHRDLKPFNVLLQWPDAPPSSRGGGGAIIPNALLSDFGTAQNCGDLGEPPPGVTSRGYTGTVEYTAPELLSQGGDPSNSDYTEKSDMWSLGIVLYSMCFSSLPFSHDDPHVIKELIFQFVKQRRSSFGLGEDGAAWLPRDVSGRLGPLRLVMAALLSVDADRRPATMDLLENPVFRRQAAHNVRSNDHCHAALPDSARSSYDH